MLTEKILAREKRVEEQSRAIQASLDSERERIRREESERNEELYKVIEDLKAKLSNFESRISPSPIPPVCSIDQELQALRMELQSIREGPINYHDRSQFPETGISIRDALENIPIFNGNNIPILHFGRACKRALDIISPHSEPRLVRAIRTKLQGRAYTAIEDELHNTVDDLIESLRNKFSPLKHSSYYRGQLSDIHKLPQEHILDYIGRIKDLKLAILDGERQEGKPIDSSLDSFILTCFIKGLPTDHRILLKLDGYSGLQDAFNKATIIANELHHEKERSKPKPQPQPHQIFVRPPANSNTPSRPFETPPKAALTANLSRPIITCSICNRFGHSETNCFKNPRNLPSTSAGPPRVKYCEFCKRYNHDISECRSYKFQQQQGNATGPSPPNARREPGHPERSTRIINQETPSDTELEKSN